MRLLHSLPTLVALAALSAAAADQGAAAEPDLKKGEQSEPGSGAEVHPMGAAVALLEKENADLVAASETAISELKEQLAFVSAERDAARVERDAARAEAATLSGKLKKAEAKLAAKPAPKAALEADEPVDLSGVHANGREQLAGSDYVVMATSRVSDAAGALIARGRVATGAAQRLADLVAEGKARWAAIADCEAAQAGVGIAVIAD